MHSSAMPAVSALFSGPVSVGLLAGVVSGLFYLVVAGIRWAGEVKQQSEEWLYRQVQRRLHPVSSDRRLCTVDNGVGMEPETVRVREFIERLVESLVSGELDNVCIKRLHSHPEYDRMFACHHAPLCEALARLSFALQMAIANKHMADQDSPSAAHAALKLLVHQIIQEAMTLPKFKNVKPTDDDMKSLEDMESKTYEDILATAILNKVIERYQQRESAGRTAVDGNSNHLSPELMSLVAMHQPRLLNSESGMSHLRSTDDGRYLSNEYDSLSELSNTDPLSVTIEECIEEVTTFSNADDEEDVDDPDSYLPGLDVFKNRRAPFPEYGRDIVDGPPLDISDAEDEDEVASEDDTSIQPTDIINPVDSWEENWLFQKRRLKVGGVPQPMPVPMLVPNPSEDYRALIGDRDAEDVSDLSDCSDGALEDVVLAEEDISTPLSEIIPSSAVDTHDNIAVSSVDKNKIVTTREEVSSEPLDKSDAILHDGGKEATYDEVAEAKNMEYIKSAADDCLSEFGQQEGEYTEDYAAVTQRQMDSLTGMSETEATDLPELPSSPIPQLRSETSTVDESVIAILKGLVPGESDTENPFTPSVGNTELAKPPRPGTENLDDEYCTLPVAGTIAEREHKKWETAPPIPNNPYSPENIIKRLNRKHPYNRTRSSSDASVEFPESKDTPVAEKVVEQPLQVICSPSDVDFRRYGRDYYINAQPVANDKIKQSSSSPSQHQVSDATFLSVAKLEKQILNRDVYHSSFRAQNASPHFTMNPLYETEKESNQQKEKMEHNNENNLSQDDDNLGNCNPVHQSYDYSNILETKALDIVSSVEISDRFQNNPLFKSSQDEQLNPQMENISQMENCLDYDIGNNVIVERIPDNKMILAQNRLPANNIGIKNVIDNQRRENTCTESGYSSSLDSLNDPSAFLLRLTPPTQPQMVERTFESLTSIRRSGSLKVVVRKRKVVANPIMGGSLRIINRRNAPAKELW